MTEQNTAPADETTPEDEGTEQVPASEGSAPTQDADFWRKRQAGADAARAAAEKKVADYERELAKYRQAEQEKQQADLSAEARLQAKLEEAEKRAAEAESRAQAKILDTLYPNARKELPEVTDEVRLAKFEALLKEPVDEGSPEVRSMRAAKATPTKQQPKTSAEVFASLKDMPWR